MTKKYPLKFHEKLYTLQLEAETIRQKIIVIILQLEHLF
jgi:hypothetical protein